jgi:TetR/AcrR family transcriptional repressor of nem operon
MSRPSSREKLLATGLALVHRQGFTATGVQEITAAAGVPKGSFYNHFPSKEAFGLAVIDAFVEAAAPAFAALEGDAPAAERITRHFAVTRAMLESADLSCGCLLGNLSAEAAPLSEPIRARLAATFAMWRGALAAAIAEGRQQGALAPGPPPAQVAEFLVGAWEGAVARAKVERTAAPFDAFAAMLPRLL